MNLIRVKERFPAMQVLGITSYHFSLKHRPVYISELIRDSFWPNKCSRRLIANTCCILLSKTAPKFSTEI